MTDPMTDTGALRHRTWFQVTVFVVLAFGLAWLVASPLWTADGDQHGLAHPLFGVVTVAMMFTPAIAALVVVFVLERPARPARALGLTGTTTTARTVGYLMLALVVPVLLVLAGLVTSALFGTYTPDLQNFSAYREVLDATVPGGADALPLPVETLVAAQFVTVLIGAVINTVPALGEELGWRGWLLPKLLSRGVVPAILLSGVIWGLWHAPLILLGYNYPMVPGWLGLLCMVAMCTIVGAVFGWLRIRSGTVWPAALAHGAFNAAAGLAFVFADAGHPVNTAEATILGWGGWLVPALLVAALVIWGGFRAPPPPQRSPWSTAPDTPGRRPITGRTGP